MVAPLFEEQGPSAKGFTLHTHTHTRSTYGMPTHLLPLFSSPFLYALISGCANPLAKSGTLLPIWPSMTPAERDGGKNEGKLWGGVVK